jgi:predicted S18 family serine protease
MNIKNFNLHSFHIPVMGIGFTIDSPIKVAAYGISSTISLVDDVLMEKLRAFYSEKFSLPFEAISNKVNDSRAKRITAYLNMVDQIVKNKFEQLKKSVAEKGGEFEKYMNMLLRMFPLP